jgi:diacylglycerol kinase
MAYLLRTEPNAKLHALASLAVVAAGWLTSLSRVEWCVVVLAVAGVWTTEALNTALERVCDRVSPEFHPLVGIAKDLAAAAVLFSAVGALAIGALVFGSHWLH